MLNLPKHGQPVIFEPPTYEYSGQQSAKSACGYFAAEAYPDWDKAGLGRFDYFYANTADVWSQDQLLQTLAALADAMVEQNGTLNENHRIPAAYTYFGQFIDHDITANTDRENGISNIDTPHLEPLDPAEVKRNVANLRSGKLDLDSLYGGANLQGSFAKKIKDEKLLRHPTQTAMMRLGTTTPTGGQKQTPPSDRGGDILRLARLMRSGAISQGDIDALPSDLAGQYFENTSENGQPTRRPLPVKAIIGDSRNDENLAVSQMHLAMARLHNITVIHAHEIGGPDGVTSDAAYVFAQTVGDLEILFISVRAKAIFNNVAQAQCKEAIFEWKASIPNTFT